MEETFDTIHHDTGSTLSAGVDPNTVLTAVVEAAQAVIAEGGSAGESSFFNDMTPVTNLASFSVYWDMSERKYAVYAPTVYDAKGNPVSVTVPNLGPGTWYLVVYEDGRAAIVDQSQQGDDSVVYRKKLFSISNDGTQPVEQFHVGAVNLSGFDNPFIAGDDTNIVFTKVDDGDDKGKIKVDVYYK